MVGCSGWLSLALVACSSCLTAEAVVALLFGSLCPFLSLWLVRLVLALGWVVTAAVARCLALGWLSVLAALLGSLRLLWLSLGRLACSWSVGSPCGSLARSMLAEALVVGFPECFLQSGCNFVATHQRRSIFRTFPRGQILQDEANTLPETKKLNPK